MPGLGETADRLEGTRDEEETEEQCMNRIDFDAVAAADEQDHDCFTTLDRAAYCGANSIATTEPHVSRKEHLMSSQLMAGTDWDQVRQRIVRHWGLVNLQDLHAAGNSIPELVGVVQRKTGRDLGEVSHFVEGAVEGCTSSLNRLKALGREGQQTIEQNPWQSMAWSMGIGVAAGFMVGRLLFGSR